MKIAVVLVLVLVLVAIVSVMGLPYIYRLLDLYTANQEKFLPIAQANLTEDLYKLDFSPPRSGYFEVGLLSKDGVSVETLQTLSMNGHLKIERGRDVLWEMDIDKPLHFRSPNNPEIVNKAILFQFPVNTLINSTPLKISYQPESDEPNTKFPIIYVSISAAY
ncbi:hypothetical protein J6I90_09010 [Pseudidiomarina sp. 1APP75-32.1]|uniref:Uncharacterized protein n=1 Tax=Pseudidiomarina terrestris TaxID=2820060 RepID=A0AAW7QZW9_9GAMM|nr:MULTISPECIES: hypothetical protein [unclassified Pseudidiomarina]MDN7125022.1 hypothetical protein [Pseudidiomarina sp. 1APP75-32.1]MDN7129503.1 hypothetical protein [Pseudidiomarina sp. 1APR75-15]